MAQGAAIRLWLVAMLVAMLLARASGSGVNYNYHMDTYPHMPLDNCTGANKQKVRRCLVVLRTCTAHHALGAMHCAPSVAIVDTHGLVCWQPGHRLSAVKCPCTPLHCCTRTGFRAAASLVCSHNEYQCACVHGDAVYQRMCTATIPSSLCVVYLY